MTRGVIIADLLSEEKLLNIEKGYRIYNTINNKIYRFSYYDTKYDTYSFSNLENESGILINSAFLPHYATLKFKYGNELSLIDYTQWEEILKERYVGLQGQGDKLENNQYTIYPMRLEYTHEDMLNFAHKAFYEGREVERMQGNSPIFKQPTFEGWKRKHNL